MLRLCLALLALVPISGCVALGASSGRVAIQEEKVSVATDAAIGERDRVAIRHYFRTTPSELKRGAKLPAGFARYDVLPASVVGEPLPPALEGKLSPTPLNYRRLRVGQDVILIHSRNRIVADVLYNVGN